ncbi:MAG: glycosyltransferase [bacterium]
MQGLSPHIVMGENDAAQCLSGWSVRAQQLDRCVRWVGHTARALLQLPAGATHVGVELWVPPGIDAPQFARLTLLDPWVGNLPEFGPTVDVSFRLQPGRWQVLECPLPAGGVGEGETELQLQVGCDARRGPVSRLLASIAGRLFRRHAAVRRLWLRGDRLAATGVTIIVLNWNRPDETIDCLESLQRADLRGARVMVVDNGSSDDSVARLRARYPDQHVLALPENRGYAGGNNAGIRAALDAGADAVLLLNNDAAVAPDFLPPLLWTMNSHARVAAVASAIVRQGYETLDVAWLDIYFGHGLVHRRGVNALPGEGFSDRREVEVAVGCSLLLSGEALRAIGPFDDAYFAYHEEVDWCYRARQAGWQVHYQPYSRVIHGGSKSTAALAEPLQGERAESSADQLPNALPLSWNPIRTYLGARNAVRFVRKHGGLRQRLYFVCSSLYAVPLELLAVVMRREEDLMLGLWTYRRALSLFAFGPSGRVSAATLLRTPWRLAVDLPRQIRAAHRAGQTAQLVEHCRGLWDGLRDRPLPLERLRLR